MSYQKSHLEVPFLTQLKKSHKLVHGVAADQRAKEDAYEHSYAYLMERLERCPCAGFAFPHLFIKIEDELTQILIVGDNGDGRTSSCGDRAGGGANDKALRFYPFPC